MSVNRRTSDLQLPENASSPVRRAAVPTPCQAGCLVEHELGVITQNLLLKVNMQRDMSKLCKHYLVGSALSDTKQLFQNLPISSSAFAPILGLTQTSQEQLKMGNTKMSNSLHMVAGSDRCREMQRRRMACTAFFPAATRHSMPYAMCLVL